MVKKEKDVSRCSGGILADDQVSGIVPVLPYLSLSISVEHEHNFSSGLCVGSWKNSINNCSYSKGKVSSFFS